MTEQQMAQTLTAAVQESEVEWRDMATFAEDGIMTASEGFTITMADGSEFQIKVTQSKQGRGQ